LGYLSDDDDVAEHVGFEQARDACVSSVTIGASNVTTCVINVTSCVINVTICVINVTICHRMPDVACNFNTSCACTCEVTARIAAKRARRAKNARAFSMQVGIRVQMSQFSMQVRNRVQMSQFAMQVGYLRANVTIFHKAHRFWCIGCRRGGVGRRLGLEKGEGFGFRV